VRSLEPALLAGAIWLLALPSLADDGDKATRADALFREGRTLLQSGDSAGACSKFAKSQQLDPAPGTAVNLGDCSAKLGKLVEASKAYHAALELFPAGDSRIEPTQQALADVEKRIARLKIRLDPNAPSGTIVKQDGNRLTIENESIELVLDPGAHELVVSAPGHADSKISLKLAEGERRSATLKVGAPVSPPDRGSNGPSAPDTLPSTGSSSRTAALVVGAAGIVVGALGAVAFIQAHSAKDDSDAAHLRGDGDEGSKKYDSAKRWQTIGVVAFAVGGGALATGSVLWFTAGKSEGANSAFVRIHGRW
jgi:tetratricopeptide (TPR) repeat protein